ncbi:DUF2029 domain-containing protein [Acaricomes phytoseiuli]|uniref:glycosyltransferase family 87 protein n=1 Tax=Acaricomes phytoseiuli TaxID=291968 RepID=UPI0022225FFA|nr:glycosyltransferase family 87 protein [Acaricomes phytoseiuli]MCW1250198.1 DUF2029 domain-containing protein [Acaricomes phytoseiuli]
METESIYRAIAKARDAVIPERLQSWLLTSAGIWTGFLLIHFGYLAYMLVFVFQGQAFSDTNIYRDWAAADFPLEVQPSPWVYPILGLLPIWLSGLLGPGPFLALWVLLTAALNALALGVLTRWGKSLPGIRAGWWWLSFIAIMGMLGFARLDGITAPIVLIGLAFGVASPLAASLILSVATWMKIWPAAVLLPLFAVVRDRWKVALGGILITAGVTLTALAMGVAPRLLNFLTTQGSRGMQLEATFTTPWLWMSVLKIGGARMYMNTEINSMQVDGPGSTVASALMQPLFIVVALAVAALIFWVLHQRHRSFDMNDPAALAVDRTDLLLLGSLAMVSAFIVFNKVGSPQFMVWLGPVVALGLAKDWRQWRFPTLMLTGIAVTTYFIYPLFYDALSHYNPLMAFVLTVRNALLVILFIWSAKRLIDSSRAVHAADSESQEVIESR